MTAISEFILERLNTLVVVINESGNADYVSPSVKQVLGFEPEALKGEGWFRLTRKSADETEQVKTEVKQMISTGAVPVSFERNMVTANGESRRILWNSSSGPENTIVGIGYDITDRKYIEDQLEQKNLELLKKNSELVDSLKYAQNIQEAILPDVSVIRESFSDAFVLFKPRDIVSGDFYFHFKKKNKVFVAAVDCTGHGVPGALMSVIGNALLRDIIIKRGVEDPAEILYLLDEELFSAINKEGRPITNDGMDLALGVFDQEKNILSYAGAFRPLLFVRDKEVLEVKGSRYPIGFYQDIQKHFETVEIPVEKDDVFYFFSDGYIDQFGGEEGKKFNRGRFKELLLTVNEMNLEEQEGFLDYAIRNWKQEEDQTDDILVVGVKI
jgi:PAS domain S-box-containing protein